MCVSLQDSLKDQHFMDHDINGTAGEIDSQNGHHDPDSYESGDYSSTKGMRMETLGPSQLAPCIKIKRRVI